MVDIDSMVTAVIFAAARYEHMKQFINNSVANRTASVCYIGDECRSTSFYSSLAGRGCSNASLLVAYTTTLLISEMEKKC